MTSPASNRFLVPGLAVLAFVFGLALSGCPTEGVVCAENLTACGDKTCEDLQNDPYNCGGCGVVCGRGQVCEAGACACAPGAEACGSECVLLASNPQHCGACGNACGAVDVCEGGTCKDACEVAGNVDCDGACVNLDTDALHCGACQSACPLQGQSCADGQCRHDLFAACFSTGQVVGLQAGTLVRSAAALLGTAPQALDTHAGERLLAVDGLDQLLYQAGLLNLDARADLARVGAAANDILVDGDLVYVTNSQDGTLLALQAGLVADGGVPDAGTLPDGGALPPGLPFAAVDEHQFGANTFPQVMTKIGDRLYVTLYGGFGAQFAPGQKVIELDVSDPADISQLRVFDLGTLPLRAFADGGQSIPRPQGIAHRGGALYVALNNLDPGYAVAGPGYLATVPLDGGAPGLIELPEDDCLNPGWVEVEGDRLVVSCAGSTDWTALPPTTTASGLALVGPADTVLSSLQLACDDAPEDAGCAPVQLSRFALLDGGIYVGDMGDGRLFVVGVEGDQLVERRSYSAGAPLTVCTPGMGGFANVSDVHAVR